MSNLSSTESSQTEKSALAAATQPTAAWLRFVGAVVAGIVATAGSFAILQSIGLVYPTPPEWMNLGAAPTPEQLVVAKAAKLKADSGNGMVWLGIAGAVLGGLLILASGLLAGSGRRTMTATATAIISAGLFGCFAGYWIVGFEESINSKIIGDRSVAETQFMMMHAIGWAAVGLGIGLSFGLLAPTAKVKASGRSALIGAIVGGVAGAAYPILVGVAAPLVNSSRAIPEPGISLVVWLAIPALLLGAAFGRTNCSD